MTECSDCINRKEIPGDAHVSCENPPLFVANVDNIVDKKSAKEALEDLLEEKDTEVVIRRGWKGCGVFPYNFDESIILACSNKEVVTDAERE